MGQMLLVTLYISWSRGPCYFLESQDRRGPAPFTFGPENEYYQKIDIAHSKGLSSWQPNDFINCMLFYLGIHKGNLNQFTNRPCFFPYLSLVLDYNQQFPLSIF